MCLGLVLVFVFLILIDKPFYDKKVHSDVNQANQAVGSEEDITYSATAEDSTAEEEMTSAEQETAVPDTTEEIPIETHLIEQFVGLRYKNVKPALEADGFEIKVKRAYSDTVKKGYIISQSPKEGTTAEHGSTIILKVSKGPEPVIVPDVLGKSQREAEQILERTGIVVYNVDTFSNNALEDGVVIDQSIAAGQSVDKGTYISLSVNVRQEETVARPTQQQNSSSGNSSTGSSQSSGSSSTGSSQSSGSSSGSSQSSGNSSSGSSQSSGSSSSGGSHSSNSSSNQDEDSWPGGGGSGQDEDSWTGD